jgi:hypothetical protein
MRPPGRFGPLRTSQAPEAPATMAGGTHQEEVEMLKVLVPLVLAVVSMGIAVLIVLALRPELRAELGRFRGEGPVALEGPTT